MYIYISIELHQSNRSSACIQNNKRRERERKKKCGNEIQTKSYFTSKFKNGVWELDLFAKPSLPKNKRKNNKRKNYHKLSVRYKMEQI